MSLLIKTISGVVKGKVDHGARCWLGIPYAKAARFGLPEQPDAWEGVKDALRYGPMCPQFFGTMAKADKIDGPAVAEDCLRLNIWAPKEAQSKPPKPVMIWIHGGAFMAGASNSYEGYKYAAQHDIIVVTINYRLGILGFVNFGEVLAEGEVPSNLGLRDQIAAFEWVKNNIAAFGGDPERITLAGESAGSLSVSLHMKNPATWSLFQGAIMESGALSLVHDRERSKLVARYYLEELNVSTLEELKSLNINELLRAQKLVHKKVLGSLAASPWFDDDMLPASLPKAMAAKSNNVPLLAGYNKEEIRLFEKFKDTPILPVERDDLYRVSYNQLDSSTATKINNAYDNDTQGTRLFGSHLTFGMPTLNFAEKHSESSPTWFYRFDFENPLVGPTHAVELAFLWPLRGLQGLMLRGGFNIGKRKELAQRMQTHWAHFVTHSKPLDCWPEYSKVHRNVCLFNSEDRVVVDPDMQYREAWNGVSVYSIEPVKGL
ncbi:MAG: carboxylesterase family protein [Pseudomonadota bacterium]|nr:carboxylesterase family protein [Pseudomonadota bacterium]